MPSVSGFLQKTRRAILWASLRARSYGLDSVQDIKKIIDDIKKLSSHRDKDSIKKLLDPSSIMPGIATFCNRNS